MMDERCASCGAAGQTRIHRARNRYNRAPCKACKEWLLGKQDVSGWVVIKLQQADCSETFDTPGLRFASHNFADFTKGKKI